MRNPLRRRPSGPEGVAKSIDMALVPMRTFAQVLRISGADPVLIGQWVEKAAAEFEFEVGPTERLWAEWAIEPLRRHGLLPEDGDHAEKG